MKWFKHDSDTMADEKIHKLILRHGAIGYAVYFHCLELIAGSVDNENITFELKHDSELIADDLKITGSNTQSGQQIVEDIMRTIIDLNLFEESNGRIFCLKLLSRIDTSMSSNVQFRKMIQDAKKKDLHIEEPENLPEEKKLPEKRFVKPTLEEIAAYCKEENLKVNPEKFFSYYESNGWKVGRNPMKNWKMTIKRWSMNDYGSGNKRQSLVDKSGNDTIDLSNGVGF